MRLSALLLLCGCNLVFGLEEGSERDGGSGGAGASTTSGPTGGGGGLAPTGGGGGCPPEEVAGPGLERLANGSFEDGTFGWLPSGLDSFEVDAAESRCGCQSARVVLGAGYAELRGLLPAPEAGTYFARARLRASDLVDVSLGVRIDNVEVPPPLAFGFDADDEEGADGWRTAEGSWPSSAGDEALLALMFEGTSAPPNTEVLVDCVSLTFEE